MPIIYSGIKKSFLILIIFIYIYNPPFTFLPVYPGFIISVISLFLLITHLLVNGKSFFTIRDISPFLFIILLSIISFGMVIIHGTNEFLIAKGYLLYILAYVIGPYFIIHILKRRNEFNMKKILEYILFCAIIQSVMMILMLLFPNIKELLFQIQKDDRQLLHLESGGFRMLGLAYGVVWDLGFVQSMSLIFIIWLLPLYKMWGKIILLCFSYSILLISIIMSGRTGFIGMLFSISFLLFNMISNKTSRRNTKFFLIGLLISNAIILAVITSIITPEIKSLINDKVVPWAFEMFINKSEGNGLETESSNTLKEMYFDLPINTLLFGDGLYADPNDKSAYYLGTDAGYMRQVLFYGLFGSIFLYLFYYVIFKRMIFKLIKMSEKRTALMVFLFAIYFFFSHVKGDILMGGDMPLRILFLLYFTTMLAKHKQCSNNLTPRL